LRIEATSAEEKPLPRTIARGIGAGEEEELEEELVLVLGRGRVERCDSGPLGRGRPDRMRGSSEVAVSKEWMQWITVEEAGEC